MFRTLLLLASLSVAAEPDLHPAEAAVLEALEQKDPALAEQMLDLRESNPELYERKLRHFADGHRQAVHDAHLRRDPEMREAKAALQRTEAQLKSLFAAYEAAETDDARTEVDAELRAAALDLFTRKADLKRLHLERQQAHLDAMRAELEAWEADLDAEAEAWLEQKLQALPHN